jgi:hypothetical protein
MAPRRLNLLLAAALGAMHPDRQILSGPEGHSHATKGACQGEANLADGDQHVRRAIDEHIVQRRPAGRRGLRGRPESIVRSG